MESKSRTESDEKIKHAETLGGDIFFRQLLPRRVRYAGFPIGPPSEGLCPRCIASLASFVILAFRILCNAGLSTTSFSRSSCANSSSASLQENKKLRTFWCASVNSRLISSSTMRAVSSLYSLEDCPPTGKKTGCRCPSKATKPKRSLMPN